MIRRAWWLTIYSLNFFYFVQGAALGSSIFGLGHDLSQDLWVLIATLMGRFLYGEIRRITKEVEK
jgi:hypothetical protein